MRTAWNKGKKYPAPWLEEYRFGNRPKAIHKRKVKFTAEERKKIWGNRKGKAISEAHRLAISKANKGKQFTLGQKTTVKTRMKMSESHKNRTPEMIKRMLRRHPKSSLEIVFDEIITKHKLPYKWVGNGEVIIGRKNPDFVNTNGQKIAIEVYYKKHKQTFRNGLDKWKNNRKLIFKQYGWDLLFFDETQVNESDVIKAIG